MATAFSGTLALIAGLLMTFGSTGAAFTTASPSDLAKTGGEPHGNTAILTNPEQCDYGTCHGFGSGSYECEDPGKQTQPAQPGAGWTITSQNFLACSPEYTWTSYDCSGVPAVTNGKCALNRTYYYDP